MRLALPLLAAALLLSAPVLRAQDDDGAGETPAAGSPFAPTPIGGALKTSGRGGTGGSSGAGGSPVAGQKLTTFPSYAAAPKWNGGSHLLYNFNGGPGVTYAVGFTSTLPDGGTWAWVETTSSTDNCTYSAWFSEAPGGAPIKGKGCGPIETNYKGGNLYYTVAIKNKVEAQYKCLIKSGKKVYFNLGLVKWGPNPYAGGVYACSEYVLPQGTGAVEVFHQ